MSSMIKIVKCDGCALRVSEPCYLLQCPIRKEMIKHSKTAKTMLEEQVNALRYYLKIENHKIVAAELIKKNLMMRISDCRRKLLDLERDE